MDYKTCPFYERTTTREGWVLEECSFPFDIAEVECPYDTSPPCPLRFSSVSMDEDLSPETFREMMMGFRKVKLCESCALWGPDCDGVPVFCEGSVSWDYQCYNYKPLTSL